MRFVCNNVMVWVSTDYFPMMCFIENSLPEVSLRFLSATRLRITSLIILFLFCLFGFVFFFQMR